MAIFSLHVTINLFTPQSVTVRKKLVKGKWWTRTEDITADDGAVAWRGFLGEYKLTVGVPGRETVTKTFALEKGKENRVVVTVE